MMKSTSITSLRANLSREEALRALQPGGPLALARRWRHGPLRRLAEVYVPFRPYRVEIHSGGRSQGNYLAADLAFGSLDPYEFPELPGASEMKRIQTRNAVPAMLDEVTGAEIVREKVRRLLFVHGFFRLRDLHIGVEAAGETVHVPYWIGIYGSGECASLRIMDAVRRRTEGAKMRDALTRWLCGQIPAGSLPHQTSF